MKEVGGRIKRPLGVTLVALWQFSKAAFLLLVAAHAVSRPEAQRSPSLLLGDLVFVAAHGTDPPPILLPVVAVFAAAIGSGLWLLKNWARVTLMAASGWMLFRWTRYLISYNLIGIGEPVQLTPLQRQTVSMLLGIDLIIILYLLTFDVKRAFGKEEGQ